MKTYTIVVRMNEDTSEEIMDFIGDNLEVESIECTYEDYRNCRLEVETEDDFCYDDLEDLLDFNGNKCEFIELVKE